MVLLLASGRIFLQGKSIFSVFFSTGKTFPPGLFFNGRRISVPSVFQQKKDFHPIFFQQKKDFHPIFFQQKKDFHIDPPRVCPQNSRSFARFDFRSAASRGGARSCLAFRTAGVPPAQLSRVAWRWNGSRPRWLRCGPPVFEFRFQLARVPHLGEYKAK